MTLQVPFEQFVHTAKRVLGVREAYVTQHGTGALVTAGAATGRTIVAAKSSMTPDATQAQLKIAGFETYEGAWSTEGSFGLGGATAAEGFIAAVGYTSAERCPGVWVDAFPDQPSNVQVLRTMYDEFRDTGELAEVSFEEFVRLANPTVIIVSPAQVRSYLDGKLT